MQLAFEQLAVERKARPFIKWAGGKRQLLKQMRPYFPTPIKRYVEPFLGSGAVFFYLAQAHPVEHILLSDLNEELILVYKTLRQDVEGIINRLTAMQSSYLALAPAEREAFFYRVRAEFNQNRPRINFAEFHPGWLERTAQFIFLNRTCYNGLFRVNSKAEFNVPFGRYKKPRICDAPNLRAVARLLQRTTIAQGDFATCEQSIDADTFVYLDPPYRPLSQTASFTAYARRSFEDADQRRLADFCRRVDVAGAKLMLSNSDPKNTDPTDNFFEDLYREYRIKRVRAKRAINSNPDKRGQIHELLIMNYGDVGT